LPLQWLPGEGRIRGRVAAAYVFRSKVVVVDCSDERRAPLVCKKAEDLTRPVLNVRQREDDDEDASPDAPSATLQQPTSSSSTRRKFAIAEGVLQLQGKLE
jgi:hypothetical protein